jgi:hypothetical protein
MTDRQEKNWARLRHIQALQHKLHKDKASARPNLLHAKVHRKKTKASRNLHSLKIHAARRVAGVVYLGARRQSQTLSVVMNCKQWKGLGILCRSVQHAQMMRRSDNSLQE